MQLFLDLESRGVVDLRKVGVYAYAEHKSTEIIMGGWALDDDPVQVWQPGTEPAPDLLVCALADPAVELVAHNAGFERTMLTRSRLDLPDVSDVTRWTCTAARAAALCLPRGLDAALAALGLPVSKDQDGHRLMLQMCKPRRPRKGEPRDVTLWWDDAERMARLARYQVIDVEVLRKLARAVPPLSPIERETWELTERMNDRGILVDDALLMRVLMLLEVAEQRLNTNISALTGGAVPAITDHMALTRWLTARGIDDATDTGVDKAAVATLIANTELDPLVREVLLLRQDGGGSSSTKWRAMLQRMSRDHRIRGALVYCGAAATGRWASRGVQLHNLKRTGTIKGEDGEPADPLPIIADLLAGATVDQIEARHGPALLVASELLRPALVASPGALLARSDYSQIEARVNPWLAGAKWKLDAFRRFDAGTGPDLYKLMAAKVFGVPVEQVSKAQRQGGGKVPELALGFQGGAGALQRYARAYGVNLPAWPKGPDGFPAPNPAPGSDVWVVRQWRDSNPEICGLWAGMEEAALTCMSLPKGYVTEVWTLDRTWDNDARKHVFAKMHKTPLTFRRNSQALCLRLPSGRSLLYWTPSVRMADTPVGRKWVLHYRAEDAVTRQWREFKAYGGLFTENAVQATARDIMRDGLLALYRDGLLPVLTVHDEAISEVVGLSADDAAAVVQRALLMPLAWAPGLPLAADGSAGPRYGKG
jgi:DNA polymerase